VVVGCGTSSQNGGYALVIRNTVSYGLIVTEPLHCFDSFLSKDVTGLASTLTAQLKSRPEPLFPPFLPLWESCSLTYMQRNKSQVSKGRPFTAEAASYPHNLDRGRHESLRRGNMSSKTSSLPGSSPLAFKPVHFQQTKNHQCLNMGWQSQCHLPMHPPRPRALVNASCHHFPPCLQNPHDSSDSDLPSR